MLIAAVAGPRIVPSRTALSTLIVIEICVPKQLVAASRVPKLQVTVLVAGSNIPAPLVSETNEVCSGSVSVSNTFSGFTELHVSNVVIPVWYCTARITVLPKEFRS